MLKKSLFLLTLIISCNIICAVTVNGYGYLENQTNHENIKVVFTRTIPSVLIDSTYTNSDGFYTLNPEAGIYDITFTKELYHPIQLNDEILYSNATIQDVLLLGNPTVINVPSFLSTIQEAIDFAWDGDTILVQPGTYVENVNFLGKAITVASLFLTTQDTTYISQTIIDGNSNGHVVEFISGEDSLSVIMGFTITNGSAIGTGNDGCGGGIFCYNDSSPLITNCIISNNIATSEGGGIYSLYSNFKLVMSVIKENSLTYSGGAGLSIFNGSNPTLDDVIIYNNNGIGVSTQSSVPVIKNSSIYNNDGNGIYCYSSSPQVINTTITNNHSESVGSGIYLYINSNMYMENVTISNNYEGQYGGGGGIYCYNSDPIILNSIISDNSGDYGIYVESGNPTISYSDFWNNDNGNFYNCNSWVGNNITTNANGDSCDAFMNIQLDPLFVDLANHNFNLSMNSPCIDAGDPNLSFDPDGTISDMGALFFDQTPFFPIADFSADVYNGVVTLTINFADQSSIGNLGNSIDSWQWDFNNDGVIDSNQQNPQFTFYERGFYTVSLTVTDGSYSDTEIKEDFIELVNSVPIIQNPINDFSFNEDTSNSSINLNNVFDDPDLTYGDELSFSFSGNINIQVEIVDGLVTLTPDIDWFGSENITFTATDDQNEFISDEVIVTVIPVNDPPILNITGTFETDEDLPSQIYDFSSFCSQTFGETDVLTLTADNSTHINVTITDFDVVFQSNTNNWHGTEEITFFLDDNVTLLADRSIHKHRNPDFSSRDIVEQTINVTINPVNDPPTIVLPDDLTFEEDGQLVEDFSSYISDIDDDDLTLSVQGNNNVLVDIAGAIVTFTALENWFGSEMLFFTVDDNQTRATAIDSVEVIVTPVNDPPELISHTPAELSFTVGQDSTVTFNVEAEDIDSDLVYEWYVDGVLQTEISETFIYQFQEVGSATVTSNISDGEYNIETLWEITVEPVSSGGDMVISATKLYQNYPNPFNPTTTIRFDIKENESGILTIFNLKGQMIATHKFNSGQHTYQWDGGDSGSGLYFYQLRTISEVYTRKMLMLK
ncbi:MAG: Ig-like domain-containing protein [Candidatus Cloacimonadales bacterium]|nr:Ig-like domain-containing protein [Candidatus Cloacimonadales bacterium]